MKTKLTSNGETGVKVTPETFIRAESDGRFAGTVQRAGGVNRPSYFRVPTPLDAQLVMRMNRDTIYTPTIVDTSKGATITVPENLPTGRLITILLIDCAKLTMRGTSRRTRVLQNLIRWRDAPVSHTKQLHNRRYLDK